MTGRPYVETGRRELAGGNVQVSFTTLADSVRHTVIVVGRSPSETDVFDTITHYLAGRRGLPPVNP